MSLNIDRLMQIFHETIETCPPDRWEDIVQRYAAEEPELLQELRDLLDGHRSPNSLLDQPLVPKVAWPAECDLSPLAWIGPYQLKEQIGEGGMGTVWLAEQHQPVRRRVALKLIKPGMDSRQVLARFEAERQALSLMDHPNIAKVLDAGTVEAGGGRPEAGANEAGGTEAGDRRREAGGKGPIFKENPPKKMSLDPLSKELLCEVDYSATAYPPDASSLPPAADLRPPVSGLPPSTRPYFVMELVKGQPITEYCDLHQLTPCERLELFLPVCHAVQHAHQKGIIHRDIKPSNVLVAEYDGRPVAKVIDFGVAKALHQPLTEQTMFTGIGQIIGTLEYMSPEQARVNQLDIDTRSDVYSLGVLLYELLTGSTPFDRKRLREAALDELLRIIRDEEPPRPSTKLSGSETLPEIAADRRTEPARLSTLIRGELDWIVMKALDKDRNRRFESASGFALDIQRYLNDEPVLACPPSASYRFRKFARKNRAAFLTISLVGTALVAGHLGTTWQAIRATQAERRATASEHQAIISEQRAIRERDQKEAARREALVLADRASSLAVAERASREQEATHRRIAEESMIQAKRDSEIAEAINRFLLEDLLALTDSKLQLEIGLTPNPEVRMKDLLDRGTELVETRFSDKPHVRNRIRMTIANAYSGLGSYQDAFDVWEKIWQTIRDQYPKHDPESLSVLNQFAISAEYIGRFEQAEELYELAWKTGSESVGLTHPESLMALHNLAAFYRACGRYADAEPLFQQGITLHEEALGRDHGSTLLFLNSLGMYYLQSGQLPEAISLFRELVPRMQRVLGEEHPHTLVAMNNLAGCCNMNSEFDEELGWLERALPNMRKVLGDRHPHTIAMIRNLAIAFRRVNNGAEKAAPLFQEVIEYQRMQVQDSTLPQAELAVTLYGQTSCLIALEQWSNAVETAREAEQLFASSDPENYRRFLNLSMLGQALWMQQQLDEAGRRLQEGYEGIKPLRQVLPTEVRRRASEGLELLIKFTQEYGEAGQLAKWQDERERWLEDTN